MYILAAILKKMATIKGKVQLYVFIIVFFVILGPENGYIDTTRSFFQVI